MLKYLFSLRLLCVNNIIVNNIDYSSVNDDNKKYIDRIVNYLTYIPHDIHDEELTESMLFNEKQELPRYLNLKANECLHQYEKIDSEDVYLGIVSSAANYGMMEVMNKTLNLITENHQKNAINDCMECAIDGGQYHIISYLLESSGDKIKDFNDIIYDAMKSYKPICYDFCEWCFTVFNEIKMDTYCERCNRVCENDIEYCDININKKIIKMLVEYCKKNNVPLDFNELLDDCCICYDYCGMGPCKFQLKEKLIYIKEMENYLLEMEKFYSTKE